MAFLPRTKQSMAAGLGLTLLWAYWPVLSDVAARWSNDPKYSHGYLVPVFALWLLWKRLRQAGPQADGQGSGAQWWGLAFLLPGIGLHLAGVYVYLDWLSEVSLLLSLAGLCQSVGGWRLLRIAGPSIGFLAFMLPLPFRVEIAMGYPLQHLATVAGTYLLELLGFCASAQGNTIVLNNKTIDVVEACSGLGMVVTFFALAVAVAIVLDRPLLDRIVVVASAVPVSLFANIIRITATGILAETVGGPIADVVFHTLAGYLMMTLAAGLIWLELKILSRLLVAVPVEGKMDIDLALGMMSSSVADKRRRKVPVGK